MTRTMYRFEAGFFRTLGHPEPISVLEALGDGERSIDELLSGTGLTLGDPQVPELRSVGGAVLADTGNESGGGA